MIGKHCRTQRSGAKHSTANIRLMLTAIFGLTLYSSEVRTVRTDDVPPLTSHNTTPLHRSIIFYSLRYYTNSVFECYLFLLSLPNIFVQYFFPHFSFLLFCFASCFFFLFSFLSLFLSSCYSFVFALVSYFNLDSNISELDHNEILSTVAHYSA